MGYVGWAIVAMVGYGATAIFLKFAFRTIPAEVALVVTNTILVGSALILIWFNGGNFSSIGMNKSALYLVLAGVALSISIIAYYIALSRGPVSIVAPIFAMNFAVAGVLGVMFLGENLTIARVTGIALAAAAIILLAR